MTVAPEEPEVSTRSRRLIVRLALALVAVAFLALMNRSLTAAIVGYSETAQIPPLMVTGYVVFAALAGAAFGLGAMLPRNRISTIYWRRALTLAVLPAILLALNILTFTQPGFLPEWLTELEFLFGLQSATAGAILMGVAGASAVAET